MTRSIHRDSGDRRPIARDLYPLEVGNYRIGTPAIEAFYELVKSCMDHKITGALIYRPSRIGKTRAIEYLRLAIAQNFAKVTTYHVQAEHKPKHAEGPFFTSLLEAVGCPEPDKGSDPADMAICLDSYDTTCFPRGTDWSFTRFFIPNALRSGYRLAHDAQLLWNAFEAVHTKNGLPGELEIPMESLARAVEIMLKSCWAAGGQQMHGHLRFCTACMALAYHGVMHRRVGASHCPWHGVALEEHCRSCGASAPYRLNARLLGSPFRYAECRRPYAGWRARLTPQTAPPELRRAIARARCGA